MQQILNQLDPSSQNNSRDIVRRKLEKFRRVPSEMMAQEIENLVDVSIDWSDKDTGNGPRN